MPLDHPSIDRKLLTGSHDNKITDYDFLDRDILLVTFPDHTRRLGP